MHGRASFSLIAIVLLLTELFSPFAFAQASPSPSAIPSPSPTASPAATPTVSPSPSSTSASFTCPNVRNMSSQEVHTWWDNTLGTQINQITDFSTSDALAAGRQAQNASQSAGATQGNASIPIDPMSPYASIQPFIPGSTPMEQKIRPDTLAFLLSEDPKETTKSIFPNFDPAANNYDEPEFQLTIAQAMAYARSRGSAKETTFMQKLREMGFLPSTQQQGGVQLPSNETSPINNMMIPLPDMEPGKNLVSLAQLLSLEAIKGDKCLLSETIRGKVTYMAALDKDLTYGAISNQTLSGKFVFPPLNGTDKQFQPDLQTTSNQHFTASEMTGALTLGSGGANILIPSFYEDWIEFVSKINNAQFVIGLSLGIGSYLGAKNLQARAAYFEKRIDIDTKKLAAMQPRIDPAQLNTLVPHPTQRGVMITEGEANAITRSALTDEMQRFTADQDNYLKWATTLERTGRIGEALAGSGMAFGLAWLGPARLAFSVNTGQLLTYRGSGDAYLKLIVGRNAAQSFRHATSSLGIGTTQELINKYTGAFAPAKAFLPGPVFIINRPAEASGQNELSQSITRLSNTGGGWNITTRWKGASATTNFEDVRSFGKGDKYTSMAFVANKVQPNPAVNPQALGSAYELLALAAVPFIVSRGVMGELGRTLGLGVAAWTYAKVLSTTPDYGSDISCDKDDLDKFKIVYRWWTYGGIAADIALSAVPFLGVGGKTLVVITSALDFINMINPIAAAQAYWGNRAAHYVSICKDSQYKILAYQRLAEGKPAEQSEISDKLKPLTDLVGKLKMSQAVQESFSQQQADLSKLEEILNFKAQLIDQVGYVAPAQLYYVHISQSSWAVKGGLFDQLKAQGCDPHEALIASDGSVFEIGRNGIRKINPDGSVAFDFNSPDWQKRALSQLTDQQNARMIFPNKFFNAGLGGCDADKAFITMDTAAKISLTNAECPATGCIKRNLESITGKPQGNDLTNTMGKVVSVDTNEGTVVFDNGMVRFIRTAAAENALAGSELVSPDLGSTSRVPTQGVFVMGDGKVRLNGGADLGELRTIMTEKGKLEFDSDKKEIYVFLYILADVPAQSINSITPEAVKNEDGVNAVKLNIVPKAGFEEAVDGLNAAIEKVTGGKDQGFEVLETPDYAYWFTTDENGKPVLEVRNKKTGEVQQFPITGDMTRDANGNLVIPTEKGPITLNVGTNPQTGNPQLSVEGPGWKDLGDLLAAKGTGGIMTFNPSTGAITVYNGQDIPLNPDFASKGMGFSGTPEGTQGIPSNNPFGQNRYGTGTETRTTPISLPSWPENVLLAIAMLFAILGGVAVVRYRRFA